MFDLTLINKNEKKYRAVLNAIREYKKIAIFRHVHPDFDALGSAWGLATFITDNFMDKDVKVFGDNHDDFSPRLYPKSNSAPNSWFNEPFLAIILDTPNKRRVSDPRYFHAAFKIKIDHHPFVENIGEIEIIETNVSSVSELLVDMLHSFEMKISKKAAYYLYSGIVGDSGRFEYSNTTPHTFECSKILLDSGIDLNDLYRNMYLHDQNDLKVIAHILTHYQVSKKGVAYYIFTKDDLAKFKITTSQAKDHVNLFHYVDGIKIWCAIAEDLKEKCFRVSMRSEKVAINEVGKVFQGGGHPNASGAKLNSLNDLEDFISALDKLL